MKFDFTDKIVMAFGSIIILLLSILLHYEISIDDSLPKKEEVGAVTYKYRESQRKHANSVLWKDTQQDDMVYNLDSIRTDTNSESIIHLKNGGDIEMDPESMIVLEIVKDKNNIKLLYGSMLMNNHDNSQITMEDFHINNFQGNIRVRNKENNITIIAENPFDYTFKKRRYKSSKNLSINQGKIINDSPQIQLVSPVDNNRFFTDNKNADISFKWLSNSDSILEISRDLSFKSLIHSLKISSNIYNLNLQEGIYYWRVKKDKNFSNVRKFHIISVPEIVLFSPINNSYTKKAIFFNWSESLLANKYTVYIARDSLFNEIIKTETTYKNSAVLELPDGKYFWQVTSENILGSYKNKSKIDHFVKKSNQEPDLISSTIKLEKEAANKIIENKDVNPDQLPINLNFKVILISPTNGSTLDMSKHNEIVFSWKYDMTAKTPSASEFIFKLYNQSGQLIHRQKVTGSKYKFMDLSKLDIGVFTWEIESAQNSVHKSKGNFKIILSQEPGTPELNLK